MKRKFKDVVGYVFGEMIESGESRSRRAGAEDLEKAVSWQPDNLVSPIKSTIPSKISRWRILIYYLAIVSVSILLIGRAFELQVIEGGNFLSAAEENRIRVRTNHAARGVIYDRNGIILASNVPGFRVLLEPDFLPSEKTDEVVKRLSEILGKSTAEIKRKIEQNKQGEEVIISTDISHEKALILQTEENSLPGVNVEISPIRVYPFGAVASHLIGFVSEVNKEEIEGSIKEGIPYQIGDFIGKEGVEAAAENILRGFNGYDLIKVDAAGKKIGALLTTKARSGKNVTLSVDARLQKAMYDALNRAVKKSGSPGAAVAMNPKTGEVLGLLSLPSYNNNLFASGISQTQYTSILKNADRPLVDRVIGAAYPPGSTFKMVTAAAALQTGKISPGTKIEDVGVIKLGDIEFKNWYFNQYGRKEGFLDIVGAIKRSNDTFFFRVAQRLGEDILISFSKDFGLGKKSGIEIPGEVAGLVPDGVWKQKTIGEVWYPGDTLNMSIGQGYLLTTPIQMASVTATIANGGKVIRPTIFKTETPKVVNSNVAQDDYINLIKEGMKQAAEPGGTAFPFFGFKIPIGGKTGTAEIGEHVEPHAWFTAFAPYDNPEIVVTVVLENAGEGSREAAPVVKEILSWYFTNR